MVFRYRKGLVAVIYEVTGFTKMRKTTKINVGKCVSRFVHWPMHRSLRRVYDKHSFNLFVRITLVMIVFNAVLQRQTMVFLTLEMRRHVMKLIYRKYSGKELPSAAFSPPAACCGSPLLISFSGAAAKTLKYLSPVSLTSSTLAIFPHR